MMNPAGSRRRVAIAGWFDVGLHILLLVVCLCMLYPFLFMAALSFNEGSDALRGGITIWPRVFTLENYAVIFEDSQLSHAVFITVSRTVAGTLTALFCTGIVAYCFTKTDLVGYKFYMLLFLMPMYITAGIIPTFLAYKGFGLYNHFLVYVIPNLVFAYNILIMRTFFQAIPSALEESALIDGANEYDVFFKVIVPLSMPVIATIGLFNAVWQWNTWIDTTLYTRSANLDTLTSLLSKMLMEQQTNKVAMMRIAGRARHLTPETLKAAMTIVTTLPIILLYPFLQKYFVKGVMIGAVKG